MDFIDKPLFIDILKAEKFINQNNDIEWQKVVDIYNLINNNKNFEKFLENKFIEIFVKKVIKFRKKIIKEYEGNTQELTFEKKEDFSIDMDLHKFEEIAQKLSIDGDHLLDEEIEESKNAFELLKKDTIRYNKISFELLKGYAIYVYEHRYQFRKHLTKNLNRLKKDEEGDYLINDEYIVRENNDGGRNSPFWISIDVGEADGEAINKDIVVKNMFDDNKRETALIAEEIARQLNLPVAQYYPAKYIGETYKTKKEMVKDDNTPYVSKRIVITPNFLEEGEELITGDRVTGRSIEGMNVNNVPNLIREFLSKYSLSDEEIDKLIEDYKITMVYNCFINHRDCHNGNWGFIKLPNGKFKISHIFDLEGSLTENEHHIRAICADDYDFGDEAILKSLLSDLKVRRRARDFLDVSMSSVYLNVYKSKGIATNRQLREEINELIINQKNLFVKVMNDLDKLSSKKQEDLDFIR